MRHCWTAQGRLRSPPSAPDIESIQRTVSDFYRIGPADLKLTKRTQRVPFCRQVATYLCRKMTGSSLPTIGEHFARHHSTVIHASVSSIGESHTIQVSAFRLRSSSES